MLSEATDREKQEQLRYQQLKLLYDAIPNSIMASLFGSVVSIWVFRGIISPFRLYPWVILLLLIAIFRYWTFLQFRKADPAIEEIEPWFVRFRISTLFLAFAVGSGGLLLFAYDNSSYQMLLALMIVCIGSFATTTLAPHRPIVVLFLLITFFPIVFTVYLLRTEVTYYVSWFLALLTAMLIISALRINRTITDSIMFSIEASTREQSIRDYQRRLKMFVQEIPLAVIEWTLEKRIIEWNPAAEAIFGYKKQEVDTLHPRDLMHTPDDDLLREIWDKVLSDSGDFHSIQENRRRDGSLVLCEWINTPLVNDQGRVEGVISLVEDVTQRVANEKLKKEFVSIVSHELRTPVTSIKGSLGLLTSGVLDDDMGQMKQMLQIALSNTNRLHLLINDILDVDKLESGKMEYHFADTDLLELADEVIRANESYAQQYSVSVRKEALSPVCQAKVDSNRIFQVLTNLLSNAIKFSVKGGEVLVTLQSRTDGCLVSVNNHGEVIPEADRENMFSKFFQRDSTTTRAKGGTGLGLYICQKILREHGSTLEFRSNEKDGTTFYFELSDR